MTPLPENRKKVGAYVIYVCEVCGAELNPKSRRLCGCRACRLALATKERGGTFAESHTLQELRDYYMRQCKETDHEVPA